MSKKTRRVAVVGIDGAGKSTLIRRFLETAPVAKDEVEVLRCPLYHETPDAPLGRFSRDLDAFSRAADALASFELKAVAMFYQMTLYGPVERFLIEELQPRLLLSERHALVDSLAYGPFYRQMVRKNVDPATMEGPMREGLGTGWESVLRWHGAESRRLGRTLSLWELPLHVTGLFQRPLPDLIAELSRQYRTELPDVVLLLDVPAATAARRVAQREGAKELHEEAGFLEALRKSYHQVLEALRPLVETHVIDTGKRTEESLREIAANLNR